MLEQQVDHANLLLSLPLSHSVPRYIIIYIQVALRFILQVLLGILLWLARHLNVAGKKCQERI